MDSVISMGDTGKLGFLDVWKFLNTYGSLFFKRETGHFYEAKACRRDETNGSVRCIRFFEDNKDYLLVCEDCWNQENTCDGVDISGFKNIIKDYILTAYIE